MSFADISPLKRSSSDAGFDVLDSIHQAFKYDRHHALRWRETSPDNIPFSLDENQLHALLLRSIGLALEAVGFEGAELPAIESFKDEVKECTAFKQVTEWRFSPMLICVDMAHFLNSVRKSMLSSRRTQPLPQDFLLAFGEHHLTLKSLLPHLDPPVSPLKSQFPLCVDSLPADEPTKQLSLLGRFLNGTVNKPLNIYVPQHFPDLPSQHTYKATAEFTKWEDNPKKIRERATEDSRMGEEALRRLVSVSLPRNRTQAPISHSERVTIRRRREELWEVTMDAMKRDTHMDGPASEHQNQMDIDTDDRASTYGVKADSSLGPVVNADRVYWRKGAIVNPHARAQLANGILSGDIRAQASTI
ncbi:hypothetical protein MMC06_002315 [Schaereria dolodes]|nr:hypothetical protein [Schaereria dolodes]